MRASLWKRVGFVVGGVFCLLIAFMAVFFIRQQNKPGAVFAAAVKNAVFDAGQDELFRGRGRVVFSVSLMEKRYVVEGEVVIADGQTAYFKVNNLGEVVDEFVKSQPELVGYAASFESVAAKLKDVWIEVTAEDMQDSEALVSSEQQKCVDGLRNIQFSENDEKQLELLIEEGFVTIGERKKAQDSGETERQYVINTDNQVTKGLFGKMLTGSVFAQVKEDCKFLFPEEQGGFRIELWAGEKSRRFHRVVVQRGDRQAGGYFQLDFQLGQQEAPTGAVPFSKLQSEIREIFP